jgi:autotransporter-associated beta strand protein
MRTANVSARQLRRLLLTTSVLGAIGMIAQPAWATGEVADLNGQVTGGVTPADGVYQNYTYVVQADSSATTLSFLFRNDPSYSQLDNVSLTVAGGSTNLLMNGDFENGGYAGDGVTIPNNWISIGTPGLGAAGSLYQGDAESGQYAWNDGAVGGHDGLAQTIATVSGQSYDLSFWFAADPIPNGSDVDTQVWFADGLPPGYVNTSPPPPPPPPTPINASTGDVTSNLGGSLEPIFNGGTLIADSSGLFSQAFTVNAVSGNTINANGNTPTFSGVFSGAGGLIITGGAVTFSGVNTYTGATVIILGATLLLTGAGSIADSGDPTVNGTFDISGTTAGASIVSLSGSGSVLLGRQTLTLTGAADTFSGVIADGGASGGTGGVVIIAGGTETLSGVNTFTGATTINSGATLALSGTGSIATSSSLTVNGTLDISATTAGASIQGLSGSGQVSLGSQNLSLTGHSAFSGVIADGGLSGGAGGSLTIASGGATLSGVNTYTGFTTINAGASLNLAGTGSIAASTNVVDNGGFYIGATNAGAAITTLSGSGGVSLGAQTLTLTNASTTFSGGIVGTGGLTIAAGTETLGGSSSYTGATAIASGASLYLSGTGSIAASANVVDNGGFYIDATSAGAAITTISGAGGASLGAQTLTLTNASTTFSGGIVGTGGLTIAGGTETLSGVNTFTGATTINSGATLALSGTGSIATSSSLTVNGTLDISATTAGASIQSLSGSGQVSLGSQNLSLTGYSAFSGVIADGGLSGGAGGSLTIASGGATLSGVNTYTGFTTINAGASLNLAGTGSIAASTNVVDNGGFYIDATSAGAAITTLSGSGGVSLGAQTLTLTNASTTFSGGIVGTGGLTIAAGTETLTGANTYTGATTIGAGATLALGADTTTGSVAGNITDNGALVFTHSNAITYAGVVSGSGAVYSGGSPGSVVTLTGSNTYAGGTVIATGTTVQVGAGAAAGSIVGNVADTGTLVFDRPDTVTFPGVISGTGALTQAGTGTLTLNGVNTVSGLTTVAAGTLIVGDASHATAVLDSHIGGLSVGAAGMLQGYGTINGAVANTAGGAVAPGGGGAVGALTVGAYTQGASSSLGIAVTPGQAALLRSAGAVNLAGTLNVAWGAGTYAAAIYPIVTGSSVSGTFGTVNQSGTQSSLVYGVSYTATAADLVVEPKLGAQAYGAVTTASLDQAQSLASLVEGRVDEAGCSGVPGAALDGQSGALSAKTTASQGRSVCGGTAVWAQALGIWDRTQGGSTGAGFTNQGGGVLGGVDHLWANGAALGVAGGVQSNSLTTTGGVGAQATGDSYFASVYGRATTGMVQLDGQAFYLSTAWSLTRAIPSYGNAAAHPNGDGGGALVQASVPVGTSGWRPYVRFSYADFNRDATTESGVGPLGFAVGSASTASSRGEVGVLYSQVTTNASGALIEPSLRLGVQQEFSAVTRTVQASLQGLANTAFTEGAVNPERAAGVIDARLNVQVSGRFELLGAAGARFSGNQTEASISLGGAFHF